MLNRWFFLAVLVGFLWRALDGRVISIAAGLVVGVILSEVWKFLLWWLNGL